MRGMRGMSGMAASHTRAIFIADMGKIIYDTMTH